MSDRTLTNMAELMQENARLSEVVGQIHDALGEERGSDDTQLGAIVAQIRRETHERIEFLEQEIARLSADNTRLQHAKEDADRSRDDAIGRCVAAQAALERERACHDCAEYRLMMEAKLAEMEKDLIEQAHRVEDAEAELADMQEAWSEVAAALPPVHLSVPLAIQALRGELRDREAELAAARERIVSLETAWESSDQFKAVKEALDRQTAAEDKLSEHPTEEVRP